MGSIPFNDLGFMGIFQVGVMCVFFFVGIALLFFQRLTGTKFIMAVLTLFGLVALVLGYSGYRFAMSIGDEALARADASKVEAVRQGVAEEALMNWKLAGLTVAGLLLIAAIAGFRVYLAKRRRLF